VTWTPPPGFRPKPAWLKKPRDPYPREKRGVAVGDALATLIGVHGLVDELRAFDLLLRWDEIVGERVARRTRPDGFFKRVMWIRVANSSWLHELTTMKPALLGAVRAAAGDPPMVDDLRFHLGDRRDADQDDGLAEIAKRTALRRTPVRRLPPPPPATGPARANIERETGHVEDDELRALVRDLRIRFDK
jgi:Dna[CI] antecedent, DciA